MTPYLLDAVLTAAAVPALVAAGYLLVLAACSRRLAPPAPGTPRWRFAIVVPAHDEEGGIAETVQSLLATEYPPTLRQVVVVADNCTDGTARRAGVAGATVLVREDPDLRGKGYALAFAFDRVLAEGWADAVAVVDADTLVDPRLLRAFAARLDAGALAVQADYGVRNAAATWRTRLMAVALALVNTLRCAGRERLRCSAGLRGNGMCFAARLLREVPHEAFSIVEDLEYGIRLGMAGYRVHFAGEVRVLGEMATTGQASRSQRLRWEGGRRELARRLGPSLLLRGVAGRDRVLVDLALDLLVPPLARLGALVAAGATISVAAAAWLGRPFVAVWPWGAALASLFVYVARGWWMSGTGLRGLAALLTAPAYMAWKAGLAFRREGRVPAGWVRTERERRQ